MIENESEINRQIDSMLSHCTNIFFSILFSFISCYSKMKTHNIPIEGFPEGWKPVAFRVPRIGESFITDIGTLLEDCCCPFHMPRLIVEKTKQRRIVLEETGEYRKPFQGEYYRRGLVDSPLEYCSHSGFIDSAVKIWREVKEGER